MKQRLLELRTWGGKRRGAGRKPSGERPRVSHAARPSVRPSQPVHVSLRLADRVWNLRSERAYAVIHEVLDSLRARTSFRVAHFSIQGNHLHLIVEANGAASLSSGMRALAIRLAGGLNRMMGTSGPVLEDRFHAHVLRTPAEVRNALRYVLDNHASHRERLGLSARRDQADRYSSALARAPLGGQLDLFGGAVVRPSRSWLLRQGERAARNASATAVTLSAESS